MPVAAVEFVEVVDRVSGLVPAPDPTVVPAAKSALLMPTLPPPTRPPALTMSGGKVPLARVIWFELAAMFTDRLAAQVLFGAAKLSAGCEMAGGAEGCGLGGS